MLEDSLAGGCGMSNAPAKGQLRRLSNSPALMHEHGARFTCGTKAKGLPIRCVKQLLEPKLVVFCITNDRGSPNHGRSLEKLIKQESIMSNLECRIISKLFLYITTGVSNNFLNVWHTIEPLNQNLNCWMRSIILLITKFL